MGAPSIVDGASILGQETGIEDIAQVASGEYQRNVKEGLPRDYVQAYHPDGTTSLVQLPPMGKNGKGMQDRQQKLIHYMVNKKKEVPDPADPTKKIRIQWWYFTKPEGWEPQPLPIRCPVTVCTRAGGLPSWFELWMHIKQKHPGEVELYRGTLNAIQERIGASSSDLDRLISPGAKVDDGPVAILCQQCGKEFDSAAQVQSHAEAAHKENK